MSRPSIENGFSFWRDEVATLERPEIQIPYIPVIALTGIYAALQNNKTRLTSYDWRQAVLASTTVVDGIRQSLTSFDKDRLDNDFGDIPIEVLRADEGAALQHQCADASLMDGLPKNTRTIPENEFFLAQQLGYAAHDDGVRLQPLRLIEGGFTALRNYYPQTARYVQEHS